MILALQCVRKQNSMPGQAIGFIGNGTPKKIKQIKRHSAFSWVLVHAVTTYSLVQCLQFFTAFVHAGIRVSKNLH